MGWRRGFSAVVSAVTVLTLLVVAGCGGFAGSTGGEGTVRMVLWPGPEGDAMQQVVEEYNTGQGKKDGVKVELVLLSRSDTFTKEATEMAAKSSQFDVYFTASYLIEQHAKSLAPLDVETEHFFPAAVQDMSVDDNLRAVPLDVSKHFLFYRKDLINALLNDAAAKRRFADISERVLGERRQPKSPEKWDWQDYNAMAAYYTRQHNPDSTTQYGTAVAGKNTPFNVMYWNNLLWGQGGNWLENGQPALDSQAANDAMDIYQTAFEKGLVSPSSSQGDFPELQASMQAGAVAFVQQWATGYSTLNDPEQSPRTGGNVGIAPIPGGKAHVHFLGVGLNKHSDNKPDAERWLTYLASEEAQHIYAESGGIPSVPGALEEQSSQNEILGWVSRTVERDGYVEPKISGTSRYQAYVELGNALSGGWVNSESVDGSLQKAQESMEDLVGN